MIGALPLLVVIVVAAGLVGLPMVLVVRKRQKRPPGPVCGACGYSVLGLATMTCPECGGDLRAVGIRTPSSPPNAASILGILYFTMAVAFVAIVSTIALWSVLPTRSTYDRSTQLGQPHSGAYKSVTIRTTKKTWSGELTRLPVHIELAQKAVAPNAGQTAQLTVGPDGVYESSGPGSKVVSTGHLGRHAVLEWLKSAGIDTENPDVQREAARIAGEVRVVSRGPQGAMNQPHYMGFSVSSYSGSDPAGLFNSLISGESAESQPPSSVPIAMLVFWFGVWICGLVYMARE